MIEFSYSRQKRLDTGKVVNSVMTRVSVNGVNAMFVMAYDGDFDWKKEQECKNKIREDIKAASKSG